MDILGLLWIPDAIIWLSSAIFILYVYGTWPYRTLQSHGYDGPKPKPFTGSIWLSMSKGFFGGWDLTGKDLYGKTFALYEGRQPGIMSFDTEFLKQVLVKDFSKFTDRRDLYLRGKVRYSLLDLHGDEWRRIRNLTTPFFSSGKLRGNTEQLAYCVNNLMSRCETIAGTGEAFDAKNLLGAYAIESICRLAFGLKVDSTNDPNNTLLITCKKMLADINPNNWSFQLAAMFPFMVQILDKLGVEMWPKGTIDTLTELTRAAINERTKSHQERPDFIQAMIKAHEEDDNSNSTDRGKAMTEDEIVAQVGLFVLAGYDTVSTTASFLLYNLARHPEWQDRVLAEINAVIGDGEMTYEKLREMTCLDMCLAESQRLYPSVLRLDRKCNQETTVNGHYVPKDTLIIIPVWGLHHDPEYWPDPEKYDPERFSADNKKNINIYAFHGFGIGPRNCVGMRLAQIEVKMAVIKVLRNYNVTVAKRTRTPLKLAMAFFITVDGGIWLHLGKRCK